MQNSWIDWLQPIIPRAALLSIYKSFFRPHLNYGDVIYDLMNESFLNKLESVQCNEALVIIGAIRGSSGEKLYQKLGLESLKSWQWHRKLLLFSKLKKNEHPSYLFDIFPKVLSTVATRYHKKLSFNVKHNTCETIFFPSTVTDVNNIQILELVSTFKKQILEFLKSNPDSMFMCTIFMESNCLQDYG